MRRPRFRIGLRTVKTALAVIISLFITSLFGEVTIFPALSSIAVMSRTFDEGLLECRNQAVGICIGGLFGCLTAILFPDPPIWGIGIGILFIMAACSSLKVVFSCSLSCAIFIVACMTEPEQVIPNTLIRLYQTAIGLSVGLLINYTIIPYNNSKKIYSLMEDLLNDLPDVLNRRVILGLYPDLTPMDTQIDRLHYEMTIYRHQRFIRRQAHRNEYSYMSGCLQLAERIHQEITVLCQMDAIGVPDADNNRQLRAIGLEIPESGFAMCSKNDKDHIVTNYHLHMLLQARLFLIDLLQNQREHS